MKFAALVILILLSSWTYSFSQMHKQVDQEKIAREFLYLVFAKKYDAAWDCFAKEIRKKEDVSSLKTVGEQLAAKIKGYGNAVQLFTTMKRFQGDQSYLVYIFKFEHDVSKGLSGLQVEVVFENEESEKIFGFSFKAPPAGVERKTGETVRTSRGGEDKIGETETWVIDGKNVVIIELALVHFKNNESMLAIKVEHVFDNIDAEEAKKVSIPIVQEAILRNWLNIAKEKALALNVTLMDDIGVALCKPGLREGYRVKVSSEEYLK